MTTELPFSVPERHDAAVKTLLLAKQILDGLGVGFWLSHGTLLGAIRNNDFIPHDSDIDLGIWDDCQVEHSIIRQTFVKNNFLPAQEFGSYDFGHQYAFWSSFGVYVDLFFYVREKDHCWCKIWKSSTESHRQVFPLERGSYRVLSFCRELFKVPINAEAWLEANYGPDWRIPVPPVERGGTWHWADSPMNYEDVK